MADITKKVCDFCETERKDDEMYLSISGEFKFKIKDIYGFKYFNRENIDFCNLKCFNDYIEKTLMNKY